MTGAAVASFPLVTAGQAWADANGDPGHASGTDQVLVADGWG